MTLAQNGNCAIYILKPTLLSVTEIITPYLTMRL